MTGYQRIAMEPLVFARLAGFIAAHVPLSEDPLKRLIEAVKFFADAVTRTDRVDQYLNAHPKYKQ